MTKEIVLMTETEFIINSNKFGTVYHITKILKVVVNLVHDNGLLKRKKNPLTRILKRIRSAEFVPIVGNIVTYRNMGVAIAPKTDAKSLYQCGVK